MRCCEQSWRFQWLGLGLANQTTRIDNSVLTQNVTPEARAGLAECQLIRRGMALMVIFFPWTNSLADTSVFGCPIIIKIKCFKYLEWDSEFRHMTFIVYEYSRKMLNLLLQLIKVKSSGNIFKNRNHHWLIPLNYLTEKIGLRRISKFNLFSYLEDICQNSMSKSYFKIFLYFELWNISYILKRSELLITDTQTLTTQI